MDSPSLLDAFPYRCYAVLKPTGRYTGWRFDLAENEHHHRREARKVGGVALASAQRFPRLPNQQGGMRWKTRAGRRGAEERFRGKEALPIWSPFYLDIDAAESPERALVYTRAAVAWFRDILELPEGDIRIWFSGSKGFHVFTNPHALGIEPAADLTRRIFRPVVKRLHQELVRQGAPDVEPDLSAYSLPRLLRLPGEKNPKSDLYKTELSFWELQSLSLDDIRDLAQEPREFTAHPGSTEALPKASAWWSGEINRIREDGEYRKRAAAITGISEPSDPAPVFATRELPTCIRTMLTVRAPPGQRNRLELQLACWARSTGRTEAQTNRLLAPWSIRNRPEKSPSYATRETGGVIRAAWAHGYGFSCTAASNALRHIGHDVDCDACTAVTRKRKRTVSALRIGRAESIFKNAISLEDAHERMYFLARTACRN